MFKKSFLFVLALFILGNILAQDTTKNELLVQDHRVDSLVMLHQKAQAINLEHQEHDGIMGYRIQIFFDSGNNSKSRALWIKDQFDSRYSSVPSYVVFTEPYYRVRIGDFRTKLEAEAFLRRIERRYSNAFVIRDKIKFPQL